MLLFPNGRKQAVMMPTVFTAIHFLFPPMITGYKWEVLPLAAAQMLGLGKELIWVPIKVPGFLQLAKKEGSEALIIIRNN